ncbi:Cytochrome c oxidase subunit CcoP [hydrothermal vent metagenome]|uniref:Cytochrome c oxidase subunit CcoP n=1 Tax=hydrothermal vent metagenome TaxID=652676 RepID=A0A3B0WKU6_9ZZZZ
MPTNRIRPVFSLASLVFGSAMLTIVSTASFAADKKIIQQGEQLYNQNCSVCHQADAIGKPGFAPSLTNPELLSISSDKFLEGTIRDGRIGTGMPPFSHLGRKNTKAIVAYLRSHTDLPNISKAIDAQPRSYGDERKGKQWFNDICSTCHGKKGDGYTAGSTGTAIGKAGFLNKVSDGFIRETIKYGRSNTRMLGFTGPTAMADMSDQEIDDVIAYMRTLAK